MNTRIAATVLVTALSQTAFAEEPYWNHVENGFDKMIYAQKDHAAYWDGVQSSFANMLNHEPYAGPTAITVARGEPDAAEVLIHARLRDGQEAAFAQKREPYFDNVAASFGRMLEHESYAGPTGVTVARTLDHRVDRLVHALRQEQARSMTVATTQNGSIVK